MKKNYYSEIYYHFVFAVKNRDSLITPVIKDDLYKYMPGIISNQDQKLFIINGMPDHVHLLLNCNPEIAISNLVEEIKEHSTKFINKKRILKGKFGWQEGYGAFSLSKSDLPSVINHIKNQEEYHKEVSFETELIGLLEEYEIEYKKECLYDFKALLG